MSRHKIAVDVATRWTSPDAPRDIDSPAVADIPDVAAWTVAMDQEARLDLHGRTLTPLLIDEPVEIIEEAGDWMHVIALWQPAPQNPRGYPVWVRRAHGAERTGDEPEAPIGVVPADRMTVMDQARFHLGLRYLWGGTSPAGLDCSGLVHYSYRQAGAVVPRDAHAQQAAASPVPLGDVQPGDLYFFAREDTPVSHVGFVTGDLHMLHAPESGGVVEEAPLAAKQQAALVSAGRFLDR